MYAIAVCTITRQLSSRASMPLINACATPGHRRCPVCVTLHGSWLMHADLTRRRDLVARDHLDRFHTAPGGRDFRKIRKRCALLSAPRPREKMCPPREKVCPPREKVCRRGYKTLHESKKMLRAARPGAQGVALFDCRRARFEELVIAAGRRAAGAGRRHQQRGLQVLAPKRRRF